MLYRAHNEYTGVGGHEYASRSRMWLEVTEVIRAKPQLPFFPTDGAAHPPNLSNCIEAHGRLGRPVATELYQAARSSPMKRYHQLQKWPPDWGHHMVHQLYPVHHVVTPSAEHCGLWHRNVTRRLGSRSAGRGTARLADQLGRELGMTVKRAANLLDASENGRHCRGNQPFLVYHAPSAIQLT